MNSAQARVKRVHMVVYVVRFDRWDGQSEAPPSGDLFPYRTQTPNSRRGHVPFSALFQSFHLSGTRQPRLCSITN